MVGAYGNVGALLYLTLLIFAPPATFFLCIGASAIVAAVTCRWLPEPDGSFADAHVPDPGERREVAVVSGVRPDVHGPATQR